MAVTIPVLIPPPPPLPSSILPLPSPSPPMLSVVPRHWQRKACFTLAVVCQEVRKGLATGLPSCQEETRKLGKWILVTPSISLPSPPHTPHSLHLPPFPFPYSSLPPPPSSPLPTVGNTCDQSSKASVPKPTESHAVTGWELTGPATTSRWSTTALSMVTCSSSVRPTT